jgi:hypothetical protein
MLIKITKVRGTKVEAGVIGEKPGIVVIMAVDKKYTLLMRLNWMKSALGKNDNLYYNVMGVPRLQAIFGS